MAKSVVINERQVPGAEYLTKITVALDNNYQSPGYALAPVDFGYNILSWVDVEDGTGSGYMVRYDPVAGTIRCFQQNQTTGPLSEVPNATDLSAVTIVAWGKGR